MRIGKDADAMGSWPTECAVPQMTEFHPCTCSERAVPSAAVEGDVLAHVCRCQPQGGFSLPKRAASGIPATYQQAACHHKRLAEVSLPPPGS